MNLKIQPSQQNKDPMMPNNNYFMYFRDSLHMNRKCSHYIILTGNRINRQYITNKNNKLYFSLVLKPLQYIHLLSQNNKSVFRLLLGSLQIVVSVCKNSQKFDFQSGRYQNYISIKLKIDGQSASMQQIGRKIINFNIYNTLTVDIQSQIQFGSLKWRLQPCQPVLYIGDISKQKCFESIIKQIKLSSTKPVHQSYIQQKLQPLFTYDGPLDSLPTNQIPSLTILDEYKSPKQKIDKLYLCHDMKGGYVQDMNHFNSFKGHNESYKHSYRSLHVAQASIFNYFSHYLITIPPLSWRRVCRESRTLCLGTYIVQNHEPSEQSYLNDYTVDLLTYLCKKYQFDGYLINFQYKIDKIYERLIPWLQKLAYKLHKEVLGSRLIWYDSVATHGKVAYQNKLNQLNYQFYKICDGIFLNYQWNETFLESSIKNYVQEKPIYVGSDCWGRGSYGGGGFNTHKAIATIKKIDKSHKLVPALFAHAWTYQGVDSQQIWKLNQKCLYRGLCYIKRQIPDKNWNYFNKNVNGFTWKKQGDQMVTSFQNCQRSIKLKLDQFISQGSQSQKIQLQFVTRVRGTGPKFADIYAVTMKVQIQGIQIVQTSTGTKQASQQQKVIQLKLTIDSNIITNETVLVIFQSGHDIQKFAGHYGTRFKLDTLYVTSYIKENDWISKFKPNHLDGVDIPYITNYNLGHGKYFRLEGKNIVKNYDYLADYSTNFVYLMNRPISISINYEDSYIGGTSLLIQEAKKIKLLQILVQKQTIGKCLQVRVVIKWINQQQKIKLLYKWTNSLKLKNVQKCAEQVKTHMRNNGWIQYIFNININQQEIQDRDKLALYMQNQSAELCLLGQTAVYVKQQKQTKQIVNTSIESVTAYLSDLNPPVNPMLFNLIIKAKPSLKTKLLVQYGSNYACFCHIDNLNNFTALIQNIPVQKELNSNIKISAMGKQMRYCQIYKAHLQVSKLRQNKKQLF